MFLQGDGKRWSEDMPPSRIKAMEAHNEWTAWTDITPETDLDPCPNPKMKKKLAKMLLHLRMYVCG